MKKNRVPEVPVDDYSLDKAIDVPYRGFTLSIMPRYQEHFVDHKYEDFSLSLLSNALKDGSTFVDVGGHLGAFSVVASSLVGKKGNVFAFEPVPENNELLKKNLSQNGFSTSGVRQEAISDKAGEAEFNIPWASDSAGLYEHPNAETIRKIKVKLATLDDLFHDQPVDFIKMDTEGNELKVLSGSQALIKANPELRMLIEFNPECLESAGEPDPARYFEVLQALGFRTFLVGEDEHQLVEVRDAGKWQEAMSGREYANTYCVPKHMKRAIIAFHTAQYGGAEMVSLETACALSEKFVVDTVFPGDGPMYQEALDAGFAATIIPYVSWGRDHKINRKDLDNENHLNTTAVKNLYEMITANRYDIVIGETITMPWPALAASAAQVPFVWQLHEFGNKGSLLRFDYDFQAVAKAINDLSNVVLVHSQAMAKHFIGYGVDKNRIEVCPLGITPPKEPTRKTRTSLIFLMVGKVAEHKGQAQAVKALKLVADQGHNVTLHIVGPADEIYLQSVRKLVRELGIEERVSIKSFTKNIDKEYGSSFAYLMCSRDESFGRVTVEALLRGLPVIANNSGGTPELVKNGVNGILYKDGDIKELAAAMEKLVTDETFYNKLATAAPSSIKNYTPDNFKQYITETVLSASVKAPRSTEFFEKIIPVFAQISHEDHQKIVNEQKKVQELRAEIDGLRESNHALSNEIRNIKTSRGWKMLEKVYTAKSKLPSRRRR